MAREGIYHVPVLLKEVIAYLQIIPSGIYVDCTFGGGGHSKAILNELNEAGRLIVFDQDKEAEKNVPPDSRITFVPQNFRHLKRMLRYHNVSKVNGILADIGVSSHQINKPERGFSTRFEAELDMRMNQNDEKMAGDIIKNYSEHQLHQIFEKYGEVTNAKTLAKTIVAQRKIQALETSTQFKNALYPIVKGNPEKYFAQVFQALRIEVNDELNALKEMLLQAGELLQEGGRLAVISFHSLEDRIVKNYFKHGNFEEVQSQDIYGNVVAPSLITLTKKPVTPSPEELKVNPRARSSRLRVAEKKVLLKDEGE